MPASHRNLSSLIRKIFVLGVATIEHGATAANVPWNVILGGNSDPPPPKSNTREACLFSKSADRLPKVRDRRAFAMKTALTVHK